MSTAPQIDYEKIKGVHKIPLEELYTSGHRTCQGCESATTMRGFIKAEIVAYDALVAAGTMAAAKAAGKVRIEGKEYIMHEGDVVEFRFNV